ncbi:hypothetical protein [Aquimarina mytili]|uniref:Uncharacterized protein n=1 Tax=Aquimarina mytili TaxID=874423 RepID=A0A936ZZQ3_9FLAO|nr:hypothetical protein [Aquimarina mytili]MBL0684870.1 hypothetical protein [Aquimarina mytili]
MANILGLHCSVLKGYGKLAVVILTEEDEIITNVFRSPSVFSFKINIGEILNWHKDNIISLINLYNIDAIVVKKTERNSFNSRPKNSDFFKLYLEGVMLSLAGSYNMKNRHLEKASIKSLLNNNDIYDLDLEQLQKDYNLKLDIQPTRLNIPPIKESFLAVLAYKNYLEL